MAAPFQEEVWKGWGDEEELYTGDTWHTPLSDQVAKVNGSRGKSC